MCVRSISIQYFSFLISLSPLLIFIFTIQNININFEPEVLNEISSTLNDYPLLNFKYSSDCRSLFENKVYTWPGTVLGCTCADIEDYYYDQTGEHMVIRAECDGNQTANGCKDVKDQPSVNIYSWGMGKFCSRRFDQETEKNYTYLELLKNSVKKDAECKEGYKKCGKLDDLDNYVCFPVDEECPINDIIFSETPREDLPDYNYTSAGYKYFYYTNKKTENQIITKMKAVEGRLCTHKAYFDVAEYPQYILDLYYKNIGCQKAIDDQYYDDIKVLDSMSKSDLFYYEEFYIRDLFQKRDEYPWQSLHAKMNLYTKKYIGFDYQCLVENNFTTAESFGAKFMESMMSIIEGVQVKISVIKWFSVIGVIVDNIACGVINIDSRNYWYLIFIWALITSIFYIGMGIPIHMMYNQTRPLTTIPLCGSSLTNEKISYFNAASETLYNNSTKFIYLLHAQGVFLFIMLVIRFAFEWDPDYVYHNYNANNYNANNNNNYNNVANNDNNNSSDNKKKDDYYSSSDYQPPQTQENKDDAASDKPLDYKKDYGSGSMAEMGGINSASSAAPSESEN